MLRVNNLIGFGGAPLRDIESVGTVAGNTSGTPGATHSLGNINVGSADSDKKIIMGFSWKDSNPRTISSASVGGVALAERVAVAHVAGSDLGAAIWTGDIQSINGSKAISVTFSGGVDSVGVSGIAVKYLRSQTPTMSDTDDSTGAEITITNLAASNGGISFACGVGENDASTLAWGTLTEKADVATGGGGSDHRHGAAWDLGARAAANETFISLGDDIAVVGAGFR